MNRESYRYSKEHGFKLAVVGLLVLALCLCWPSDLDAAPLSAQNPDPGEPDSLVMGSVTGLRGGKAVVPIWIVNDELLGGVTLVFAFEPMQFILDSISFVGGVAEVFAAKFIEIDSTIGSLRAVAFTADSVSAIQPGRSLLGSLHFSVLESAEVRDHTIDTTTINPPGPLVFQTSFSTLQVGGAGNETVFPRFAAGTITVPQRSARADSLFFSNAVAAPIESVIIEALMTNETPLVTLRIPVDYSSPLLKFDSAQFTGTRGSGAGMLKQFQHIADSQQVLISLDYFDTSPLEPGSGALFRLYFTVDAAAPQGVIPIDTSSYLGLQSLEIISTVADGSVTSAPYFAPGSVSVTGDCCDLAGDANNNSSVNIGDIMYIINLIFNQGPALPCEDEGDVNASGFVTIADVLILVEHIFNGADILVCGATGGTN